MEPKKIYEETWAAVRGFESGRIEPEALLSGVSSDELGLEGPVNPTLVAILYKNLRPTEAYVYKVRGTKDPLARDLVRRWRSRLSSIEGLLLRLPVPQDELGGFGVFALERDITWAIGVITGFADWGY